MAKATKAAPAVVEEPAEEGPEYAAYATKAPTALQARFVPWIMDKTGYDASTAKSKQEAFEAGVRMAVALRIPFQRSDENQAARAEGRANGAAEAEAAPPAKKAGRKAAKATAASAVASGGGEDELEPAVTAPAEATKATKPRKAARSRALAF